MLVFLFVSVVVLVVVVLDWVSAQAVGRTSVSQNASPPEAIAVLSGRGRGRVAAQPLYERRRRSGAAAGSRVSF